MFGTKDCSESPFQKIVSNVQKQRDIPQADFRSRHYDLYSNAPFLDADASNQRIGALVYCVRRAMELIVTE